MGLFVIVPSDTSIPCLENLVMNSRNWSQISAFYIFCIRCSFLGVHVCGEVCFLKSLKYALNYWGKAQSHLAQSLLKRKREWETERQKVWRAFCPAMALKYSEGFVWVGSARGIRKWKGGLCPSTILPLHICPTLLMPALASSHMLQVCLTWLVPPYTKARVLVLKFSFMWYRIW